MSKPDKCLRCGGPKKHPWGTYSYNSSPSYSICTDAYHDATPATPKSDEEK